MNNERINNLLTIAKRLDTETKNRSITISTEEMIDLLESYKELKNQISDLLKLARLKVLDISHDLEKQVP